MSQGEFNFLRVGRCLHVAAQGCSIQAEGAAAAAGARRGVERGAFHWHCRTTIRQAFPPQAPVRARTPASPGAGTSSAGTIVPGTDEQGRSITLGPLLLRELDRGRSQGTTYQWVLINGGINDLGRGNRTAEQVAPLLRDMYELAMRRGAEVVAILPWPNRFVAQSSKNEAERQRLLRGIQQYASNHDRSVQSGNGGGAKGGAPRMWVDATALTEFDFWGRPDARRFQDDLLHLNAAGYDLLGERVFGTMLPGLQRSIQRLCGSGSSCAGG